MAGGIIITGIMAIMVEAIPMVVNLTAKRER